MAYVRDRFILVSASLFCLGQIAGAVAANSLNIAADAGSEIVDCLTYGINLFAEHRRVRFGTLAVKLEIYASLFSVCALLGVTTILLIDAMRRLTIAPPPDETVNGAVVLGLSCANLFLDISMGTYLYLQQRGSIVLDKSYVKREINMASAAMHVFADTCRSITGIIAGSIEVNDTWENPIDVDAYATFVVCFFIIGGATYILFEAIQLLKQYKKDKINEQVPISMENTIAVDL